MRKITTIEKAMNQFAYRLQNGKYEPNQTDLDAFKFVAEWINREKAKEIRQNSLFAKLFCHVFYQEIEYYKGDFNFAQKKIHQYIKQPIEFYYEEFTKKINNIAFDNFTENLGVNKKHPVLRDEIENKKNNDIFIKNQKEIEKYFIGIHKEEKVFKSLNNTISEFINLYKNKP